MTKTALFIMLMAAPAILLAQGRKISIGLMLNNPVEDEHNPNTFFPDFQAVANNMEVQNKSFSAGLVGALTKSESSTFRIRLGITQTNILEQSRSEYVEVEAKQFKFHFAPGILWHEVFEKFTITVGFEMPINYHGAKRYTSHYTATGSSEQTSDFRQFRISDGFSTGFSAVTGFSYHLSERFSLAAEFAPGLLYSKIGGKNTFRQRFLYPDGSTVIGREERRDGDQQWLKYQQRFSFVITYSFRRKS